MMMTTDTAAGDASRVGRFVPGLGLQRHPSDTVGEGAR
jgi:hypothetical protein